MGGIFIFKKFNCHPRFRQDKQKNPTMTTPLNHDGTREGSSEQSSTEASEGSHSQSTMTTPLEEHSTGQGGNSIDFIGPKSCPKSGPRWHLKR